MIETKQPPRSGKAVLVVDDEEEIRSTIKEFLENALPGVRVVAASSGQQGIEMLSRHHFELIISDYRMPGKNGLEFLVEAYLRAPDTPRIMMTAYPEAELAVNALQQAHVQRFMVKPIKPDQLRQYVHELIGESG